MTDKPAPQPAPLKDRLRMIGKCPPHMAREAGAEIERLENEVAVLREQRNDLVTALYGRLGEVLELLELFEKPRKTDKL